MVEEKLHQAPLDHNKFNRILSLEKQVDILNCGFRVSRENWLETQNTLQNQGKGIALELQDIARA